jgi:hypothetical protein
LTIGLQVRGDIYDLCVEIGLLSLRERRNELKSRRIPGNLTPLSMQHPPYATRPASKVPCGSRQPLWASQHYGKSQHYSNLRGDFYEANDGRIPWLCGSLWASGNGK